MTAEYSSQRSSSPFARRGLAGLIVLLSLGCLALFGCRGASEEQPKALPLPPAALLLPEVTETPEEIRAQMKAQGVSRGTPEYEELKLKLMVANDKIFQREGVEGYRPVPVERTVSASGVIDPETGKIAWLAWTCYNPDCAGRGKGGGPLIFGKVWENARIDSTNQIVYDLVEAKGPEDGAKPPIVCPSCGKVEFLSSYCSPQTELRRRQLDQELNDVRAARDQARAAGTPVPGNLRNPSEIQQELQELPKLFLVPKEEPAQSSRQVP
jgi:hypothetical protein